MESENARPELVPIGAVIAALQGVYPEISQSSLRFLEREGLLAPHRTPGGHRLYGPADIQRLHRIKRWQAQGLSLDAIRARLLRLAALHDPADLAERFLHHALDGELPSARRAILEAADVGIALETLFLDVLRPALWTLGGLWERGEATVAQEKEVSEVARELIAELTLRYAPLEESPDIQVVAACVAGERHDLGLRMLCGLLRERGIGVHFLGPDVAPHFLADAVQRRQPTIVLLSATGDEHLPALEEAASAVRTVRAPQVIAGGQAVERYPNQLERWGVLALPDHASAVSTILRSGNVS